MKTVVSERGQITLPKAVRVDLGLLPGTLLDITVVDGHLVGVKAPQGEPEARWRGKGRLPSGLRTTDDYLAEIRG